MIKLVALDLDGTLLDWPGGTIHPTTISILNDLAGQGVLISIVTGRPYLRTVYPLEVNDLYPGSTYPHYLVCEERDIYELIHREYQPWKKHNQAALADEVALLPLGNEMLEHLEKVHPQLEFSINNGYSQRTRGFVELYFVLEEEVLTGFAALSELMADTPLKPVRNGRGIALRSRSVGKAHCVQELAAHLGIDIGAVLAVGDSHNDGEMLACGLRPATTSNADPEIKEIVQYHKGHIASLCRSQGVAEILTGLTEKIA
ncbi:MAG: HAD family phosphatase [Firmicutes bacterium]|nr:HAD family phosphatase [Bacillota bacterium]